MAKDPKKYNRKNVEFAEHLQRNEEYHDHVRKHGDVGLIKAAELAMKYFKNEYRDLSDEDIDQFMSAYHSMRDRGIKLESVTRFCRSVFQDHPYILPADVEARRKKKEKEHKEFHRKRKEDPSSMTMKQGELFS